MIGIIKLAVFDMSGTTIKDNNEVLDCFYDALLETGITRDKKYINTMMGWSKIEVFRTIWTEELGDFPAVVEDRAQYSFGVFKKNLSDYYHTHPVEPTDGCLDIFNYLRKNQVKIALNTGFYRSVTDILLEKLGWTVGNTIDYSITSDEVKQGRPQPYMIQKLMSHFGIEDPRHVFKIGDTPSDLQEGRAAGCWSFGLTNGSHTEAELMAYDNDGLFASLETFLAFLKEKKSLEVL
jgi:phosphonatase-like hydrolase